MYGSCYTVCSRFLKLWLICVYIWPGNFFQKHSLQSSANLRKDLSVSWCFLHFSFFLWRWWEMTAMKEKHSRKKLPNLKNIPKKVQRQIKKVSNQNTITHRIFSKYKSFRSKWNQGKGRWIPTVTQPSGQVSDTFTVKQEIQRSEIWPQSCCFRLCIFCGETNESFTDEGLDLHYWTHCPMLKHCDECKQVELSILHPFMALPSDHSPETVQLRFVFTR